MSDNSAAVKEKLKTKVLDDRLRDIYIDESVVEYQKNRYVQAIASFEKIFGEKAIEIYSAPGRSEVGGNHTDHQLGQVLAASISLDAIAVTAKTEDNIIRLKSEGYPMLTVSLSTLEPSEKEKGTSAGLIRGVAAGLKGMGYTVGGFEAYVTSDVLNGAGMSSSAAFEVLVGNILSGIYNDGSIDESSIAQVSQYAENVYFGKPCGLMDQMACACGGLIYISFADREHPEVRPVSVDFDQYGHSLCIVDTKGSHANLTDEYAAIPQEMKAVAACFGKEVLNEVDKAEFFHKISDLRASVGDRAVLRAMHWFSENERVKDEVKMLEEGDFDGFKKLVKASGDSSYKYLQNVYSVKDLTKQEMSLGLALSDAILDQRGVSRVHGGGFAGTIQAFVPDELVKEYKERIEAVFGDGSCHVLKVRKYGGMKVI